MEKKIVWVNTASDDWLNHASVKEPYLKISPPGAAWCSGNTDSQISLEYSASAYGGYTHTHESLTKKFWIDTPTSFRGSQQQSLLSKPLCCYYTPYATVCLLLLSRMRPRNFLCNSLRKINNHRKHPVNAFVADKKPHQWSGAVFLGLVVVFFFQEGAGIAQSVTNLDFCILFHNTDRKKPVKATLCLSKGSPVYEAFLSKPVIIYTYGVACLTHSTQDTFVLQNKTAHAVLCHPKSRAYLAQSSHLGRVQCPAKSNICATTSRKSLLWVISLWIHSSWNQRNFWNRT